MVEEFKSYIHKEKLFLPEDHVLLAVSGGMDSCVMAELFRRSGYSFAIAHCNFQLRGEESEQDEAFVREIAENCRVPFFFKRFQTKSFARENRISLQMAARQLRYEWFDSLLTEEGFDYLATAHHQDDQVETFLINLARGTGIAGLHGILPKQGEIIRPMLFTDRKQISLFVEKEKISFREDSSNRSLKYTRNRIRHKIIPQFEKINPSFKNEMEQTIMNIRDAETIFRSVVDAEKKRLLIPDGNGFRLPVIELKKLKPGYTWLFELISGFGFSSSVTADIYAALDEIPGKEFFSPTHRIVKDREFLLIRPLSEKKEFQEKDSVFYISSYDQVIDKPIRLKMNIIDHESFKIPRSENVACLDLDKLSLPLLIRRWKKGDYFYPFGMKNRKKLSDFFIDQKFSLPDKESAWLLCCGKDIAWIIGHRIDDRFKVTDKTKKILQLIF